MKKENITGFSRGSIITIVFFSTMFLVLCLLVPVWQGSVSMSLNHRLIQAENSLKERNEEVRVLKAKIEKESSPERVIQHAEVVNIDFCDISVCDIKRVAFSR